MTTVEIPDAARQHAPTTAPALVAGEVWRTLSGPFMCTGCGGRFILCPVFVTPLGPVQDLELGLEKTKVLFRDVADVTKGDLDDVIFG